MSKYVYVVTTGTYSSYTIQAVFSSEKLAKEYMNFVSDEDYNHIEKYPLDCPISDKLKAGYSLWQVLMLKNGDIEKVEKIEVCGFNIRKQGEYYIWERSTAPAFKDLNLPNVLTATVLAKDEKHAVKITNEYRVQMIASNKW